MAPSDRTDRALLSAAAAFALAVVLHNSDHLRRGSEELSADVFVAGSLAIVLEVAIVTWACQRHRVLPLAAAVVGGGLAVGYVVVHFLPERSWLSDSLADGADIDALTWTAASLEVVAALLLAGVGWWALRQRGGLAAAAEDRAQQLPLRAALAHPLAAAFLASQLAVLVISFLQR